MKHKPKQRKPKRKPASAPAVDSALAAPIAVRSEGQRLLLGLALPLATVAAAVGSTHKTMASDWRNGRKVPGLRHRAALYRAYDIPPLAWSQTPKGGVQLRAVAALPPDSGEVEPTKPSGAAPTTLDNCLQLLAIIQRDRNQVDLLPTERVKLADTEARILALRHKLEREAELTEDKVIREHPQWQRVKRAFTAALLPYPAAAKAVADALAAVGDL